MKTKTAIILAFCLTLIGCFSIPYDTLQYTSSRKTTFTITRQTYNSLKGNFTAYAYPIYSTKPGISSSSDMITLEKIATENGNEFYNVIHTYWGNDWRFMVRILIKIDAKLVEMEDKSPNRTVGFPTSGMVEEKLTYPLENSVLDEMSNCSAIQIEYYGEPVAVGENELFLLKEAIQKMKELAYVAKK
jgi:hypothetical protein